MRSHPSDYHFKSSSKVFLLVCLQSFFKVNENWNASEINWNEVEDGTWTVSRKGRWQQIIGHGKTSYSISLLLKWVVKILRYRRKKTKQFGVKGNEVESYSHAMRNFVCFSDKFFVTHLINTHTTKDNNFIIIIWHCNSFINIQQNGIATTTTNRRKSQQPKSKLCEGNNNDLTWTSFVIYFPR